MIKLIKRIYDWYMPFWKKMNHDNVFAIAAQAAFFIVLSAVPLVMFFVSLLQYVNISPDFLKTILGTERSVIEFNDFNDSISDLYGQNLSISIITIIATLWSASKGIHAITNGLNRVHDTYENRNWLVIRLRAMLFTFVFLLILFVTVIIIFLGSLLNNLIKPYISDLPYYVAVIYSLRYILMFLYQVFLFALMYRGIPNLSRQERKKYRLRCQLPGAVFCAASWHVLLFAISVYVTDFNGFSIYKGLTQLAIVMVFMYFCMVCMMIGAEINVYFHNEIDWFMRRASIRYLIKRHKLKKAAKSKTDDK